jgi:PelA/Pel-15E family pectate lyase
MLSFGCARTRFGFAFVFLVFALLTSTLSSTASAQWGGGQTRWKDILKTPPDFYGSDESKRVAENVLLYQNDNGGWPKNIDMANKLSEGQKNKLAANRNRSETLIDNGATWTQIRFLALMHEATGDQQYADAATRGLNYLLEAQYDNGGWPMIYPIRKGYYSHITFNDGAMIGVLTLLKDVAQNKATRDGKHPFAFVDPALREPSQQAVDKGVDVIVKTQVLVDGKPTAWCAQYDEYTLEPAPARSYELVSISGYESVGIVKFLMQLKDPSPEVKRAIDAAVAWFDQVKIEGQRVEMQEDPKSKRRVDRVVVEDPSADPLWARFYQIGTNRPMFVGRDGVIHDHLADIERERRLGYSWLGDWPSDLLEGDYADWQKKWENN